MTQHTLPPDRATIVVGGALPRADDADEARSLIGNGGTATLATIAVDPPGFPFGSIVSYAVGDEANPLFLISELAEHTRNLRADGRASLLAAELHSDGVDPLAVGRVTLLGPAQLVSADEAERVTDRIVGRHPSVAGYADYRDFKCWRLDVTAVRWVGGFGRMSWIAADTYRSATVDPVLASRRMVVEHMNTDHSDACTTICQQALADAGHDGATVRAAWMDRVDRFGGDFSADTSAGPALVRVAFDAPAMSLDAVRHAVVALLARQR